MYVHIIISNAAGIRMGDSTVILSEAKDLRSEASVRPSRQTLRGVYTERSECAQCDSGGADFIIHFNF
jgi:hypothetical protein